MKMKLISVIIATSLTGCATTTMDPNYAKYLDSQVLVAQSKQQKPLVTMKALPGQTIQLSGVEEFTVYAPEGNATQNNLQQYVPPRSDAAEITKSIVGVIGTVGGIYAGGAAATMIVKATGQAANAGYQYVQSPQPNMSIGGNGVIGTGSYTSNANPTTQTLGAGAVLGSGASTTIGGNGSAGAGASYANIGGNGVNGAGTLDSSTRPTTTTTTYSVGGNGTTGSGNYAANPSTTDSHNTATTNQTQTTTATTTGTTSPATTGALTPGAQTPTN